MSISIVTFVDWPLTAKVPRLVEVCLYVLGAERKREKDGGGLILIRS